MGFNIIIYSIRDITTIKIKWSINGIVCYIFATWNSSKVMSIFVNCKRSVQVGSRRFLPPPPQ